MRALLGFMRKAEGTPRRSLTPSDRGSDLPYVTTTDPRSLYDADPSDNDGEPTTQSGYHAPQAPISDTERQTTSPATDTPTAPYAAVELSTEAPRTGASSTLKHSSINRRRKTRSTSTPHSPPPSDDRGLIALVVSTLADPYTANDQQITSSPRSMPLRPAGESAESPGADGSNAIREDLEPTFQLDNAMKSRRAAYESGTDHPDHVSTAEASTDGSSDGGSTGQHSQADDVVNKEPKVNHNARKNGGRARNKKKKKTQSDSGDAQDAATTTGDTSSESSVATPSDDGSVYAIERLVDHKIEDGKVLLEVKWSGFTDTTFEPEADLHAQAPILVHIYWRRKGGRENALGVGKYLTPFRISDQRIMFFGNKKRKGGSMAKKRSEYRVEWVGLAKKQATWVPALSLFDTHTSLIREYLVSQEEGGDNDNVSVQSISPRSEASQSKPQQGDQVLANKTPKIEDNSSGAAERDTHLRRSARLSCLSAVSEPAVTTGTDGKMPDMMHVDGAIKKETSEDEKDGTAESHNRGELASRDDEGESDVEMDDETDDMYEQETEEKGMQDLPVLEDNTVEGIEVIPDSGGEENFGGDKHSEAEAETEPEQAPEDTSLQTQRTSRRTRRQSKNDQASRLALQPTAPNSSKEEKGTRTKAAAQENAPILEAEQPETTKQKRKKKLATEESIITVAEPQGDTASPREPPSARNHKMNGTELDNAVPVETPSMKPKKHRRKSKDPSVEKTTKESSPLEPVFSKKPTHAQDTIPEDSIMGDITTTPGDSSHKRRRARRRKSKKRSSATGSPLPEESTPSTPQTTEVQVVASECLLAASTWGKKKTKRDEQKDKEAIEMFLLSTDPPSEEDPGYKAEKRSASINLSLAPVPSKTPSEARKIVIEVPSMSEKSSRKRRLQSSLAAAPDVTDSPLTFEKPSKKRNSRPTIMASHGPATSFEAPSKSLSRPSLPERSDVSTTPLTTQSLKKKLFLESPDMLSTPLATQKSLKKKLFTRAPALTPTFMAMPKEYRRKSTTAASLSTTAKPPQREGARSSLPGSSITTMSAEDWWNKVTNKSSTAETVATIDAFVTKVGTSPEKGETSSTDGDTLAATTSLVKSTKTPGHEHILDSIEGDAATTASPAQKTPRESRPGVDKATAQSAPAPPPPKKHMHKFGPRRPHAGVSLGSDFDFSSSQGALSWMPPPPVRSKTTAAAAAAAPASSPRKRPAPFSLSDGSFGGFPPKTKKQKRASKG